MIALLSSGTWTLLAFCSVAVFGVLAWKSLQSNIRKIDYPDPAAASGEDDTTK